MVASPLRYPGGKSKALKKILPLIPQNFSEYREPFVGGGSVFIALKQKFPNAHYKIGDLNYNLYCFWNQLKTNFDELIKEIYSIKNTEKDGRQLYKSFATTDKKLSEFERAIRFFVLNRITYSGTVDSGGYSSQAYKKRFTISSIERLQPISNLIQDVEITYGSYEKLLFEKGNNIFIYLDPPYLKSTKWALYGKNGDLNMSFDHKKFAKDVNDSKHKCLITIDDSEEIRKILKFKNIFYWELQYGMNNVNGKKPKKGKEIILTNYLPFMLKPVKNKTTQYDNIINKFLNQRHNIVRLNIYNRKSKYNIHNQIKKRIIHRNLNTKIKSSIINKNIYLEKF